eukprot:GHRR01029912.1.p1 GENE.GHRR01029912.1~~GHRR01029912.1.p1  ORF type:complete len:178 (+),score=20.68 GHRR01029912.1:414-947(+)
MFSILTNTQLIWYGADVASMCWFAVRQAATLVHQHCHLVKAVPGSQTFCSPRIAANQFNQRHITIIATYRACTHLCRRTCIATVLSKLGTLSHSFCNSFMAAGLRMSGRILSAWPSLMYLQQLHDDKDAASCNSITVACRLGCMYLAGKWATHCTIAQLQPTSEQHMQPQYFGCKGQ